MSQENHSGIKTPTKWVNVIERREKRRNRDKLKILWDVLEKTIVLNFKVGILRT